MVSSTTLIMMISLIIWTLLCLYYRRGEGDERGLKVYYGILGILRTSWGLRVIDKIGRYKFWQKIGFLSIPIAIVASIITLYTFISSTLGLFSGSIPKESSKPIIFLFGDVIPWIPGIIALVLGITLHELAHGIVARSFNLRIKSTGLILLLGIPLGAFVEIGEDFKKASRKIRGAVASAGPVVNILLFLLVFLITPYVFNIPSTLTVTKVIEDFPASGILMEGDIIHSINGRRIRSLSDFQELVKEIGPGETIAVTVVRGEEVKTFQLTTSPQGKIGIVVEPSKSLVFIIETLFWTGILNLLLGFFNLLPALPLDGFHIWNAIPEIVRDLKANSKITETISKYIEYLINERSLTTISVTIWLLILASILYSLV
ncbi:MAG TPA: PDZ domain-containing protein [Methanococcaceae archaeon]|uniref:PDZ domain-containing protein n=1 Tax=Methanothermococcus okinawensis TaxID=155863 RepID=A0A833E3V7_9EURY|nr:PDZ domain-containing protein [Methanococcaceae archaeon]HIP91117.1 PDZ domain-containing protein [Methanothermococcus okinawensis]